MTLITLFLTFPTDVLLMLFGDFFKVADWKDSSVCLATFLLILFTVTNLYSIYTKLKNVQTNNELEMITKFWLLKMLKL